jgi:hypothetical protein
MNSWFAKLHPARLASIPADQVYTRFVHLLTKTTRSAVFCGFAVGLIALCQLAMLVASFGTSPMIVIGYGVAFCVGAALANVVKVSRGIACLTLIATACLGLMIIPQLALMASLAPVVIIPCVICLSLIPTGFACSKLVFDSKMISPSLVGCAIGLAVCFFLDPVTYGLAGTSLAAAALLAVHAWMTRDLIAEPAAFVVKGDYHGLAAAVCSGIAGAVAIRFVAQLMPPAAWTIAFGLTAFCGWTAFAIWAGKNQARRQVMTLAAALCVVGTLAAFPLFVEASLAINGYASWSVVLFAARGVVITSLMAAAGLLFGCSLLNATSEKFSIHSTAGRLCCLCVAFLLAKIGIIPAVGVAVTGVCVTGCLTALVCWKYSPTKLFQLPAMRRNAGLACGAAVCGLMGYVVVDQTYQPQMATNTLFSTVAFQAYRAGVPLSRISVMNDARTTDVVETATGTFSTQVVHGSQWQVRKNGIIVGALSTTPLVTPQSPADVVSAVLPILLHEGARDVQILGAQAGTQIRATLAFPVTTLEVVEGNSQIIKWLNEQAETTQCGLDLNDPRLTIKAADPTLANITGSKTQFDLILCNTDHSALFDAAGGMTYEYYQHAAKRLKADGFFAQRFQIADYGSAAIATQLATLSQVFKQVSCFEIAPGEMLLLGTNSDSGFLRGNLLERAVKSHVQNLLAEIGWDPAILFNLAYVSNGGETAEAFQTAIAKAPLNTTTSGTAMQMFPRELIRWADKRSELQREFAACSLHLIRHLEVLAQDETIAQLGEQLDDVKKRLTDTNKREQLIASHPDEPWLYRTEIKHQLTENPRSQIVPVKGEGLKRVVHQADHRRLDYFEALGRCLNQSSSSEADYVELKSYLQPFDPLVSEFIHPELARICQQRGSEYAYEEFLHRLHTITFSPRSDRSVRDIHRVIELLSGDELTEVSPAQKYDIANAMLEILKFRWDLRASQPPLKDNIVLNDISSSIDSINTAFALLERTSVEPARTTQRCEFVKKELLAPLADYRMDLMNKQAKPKLPTP